VLIGSSLAKPSSLSPSVLQATSIQQPYTPSRILIVVPKDTRKVSHVACALSLSLGFQPCHSDPCVYVRKARSGNRIWLGLFVDDLIPIFPACDEGEWNALKSSRCKRYTMKDMGDAEWILGMKVTRDRRNRTITLSQASYIDKILSDFHMDTCGYIFICVRYSTVTYHCNGC